MLIFLQGGIPLSFAGHRTVTIKDPVSGYTHLAGAVASVVGLAVLIVAALSYGTPRHIISYTVFGVSLICLYSASAAYHLFDGSAQGKTPLRTLDHMMIYVLIAGTYTPVCLIALNGSLRWIMFAAVWSCAAAGILTQGLWFNAPRWLSTAYYTIMGWLGILVIVPLWRAMSAGGIAFLLGGGLLYTIGAVIYAAKLPHTPWRGFGFHEIFHLFVIGGSLCHYLMILLYVTPIP